MLDDWRRRRRSRRLKPGDGRPLRRFRWWQLFSRSLFHLPPDPHVDRATAYAVDVRLWGDAETGEVKAHLYADGRLRTESRLPAAFPVEGGEVEVAATQFGLRRCHLVTADGRELQLSPDRRSAEGRRARLDQRHPGLSRTVGAVSVVLLLVGLVLVVLQVAEPIAQVPPVVERFGRFESPIDLPWGANVAVGLVTVAAAVERATRLRYHWLLDGAAG